MGVQGTYRAEGVETGVSYICGFCIRWGPWNGSRIPAIIFRHPLIFSCPRMLFWFLPCCDILFCGFKQTNKIQLRFSGRVTRKISPPKRYKPSHRNVLGLAKIILVDHMLFPFPDYMCHRSRKSYSWPPSKSH